MTGQCNCKRGVSGRRCDKCELPRHLLMDYECQRECETRRKPEKIFIHKILNLFLVCDNCTQTLLDTVDEIIYKFEVDMQDVSLTNLNAPWLKLHRLSNETDFLGSQFDDFFDAIDSVDNFNDVASEEVSFESFL